jgi:hypothetical protein
MTVAEVEELPRSPGGRGAGLDRLAVEEDLDDPDVAGEVAGVGVRPREGRRGDLGVVLGLRWRAMAEPGLDLEERHRLLRIGRVDQR